MIRALAVAAVFVMGLLLSACAEDAGSEPSRDSAPAFEATTSPQMDDVVLRVTIDGMPCLIWKDKVGTGHDRYAYSGLTCDWSKANQNLPR